MKDINKEKQIYQSIKSKQMSNFNLVLSSKSRICDLVVLGVKEDLFIKILFFDCKDQEKELIEKVKSKVIWKGITRFSYIFYYYDENYNLIKEKKITL